MKYVNIYVDFIRKCYSYIDTIHTLSTGYFQIDLIPPSQLNVMITQVKKAAVKTNPE